MTGIASHLPLLYYLLLPIQLAISLNFTRYLLQFFYSHLASLVNRRIVAASYLKLKKSLLTGNSLTLNGVTLINFQGFSKTLMFILTLISLHSRV